MSPVFADWSYNSQVMALLLHCKFSCEMRFCTKFYNGFILTIYACAIMSGFCNYSSYMKHVHMEATCNTLQIIALKNLSQCKWSEHKWSRGTNYVQPKWSPWTIYVVTNGPPGPLMPKHKWSW